MQGLPSHLGLERRRPPLDQPQPEVDMAERAPLLGRLEDQSRPPERPADVVEERGGEQQVVLRRGWSWQSSRQMVVTPTVCSSRPPAQT